MSRSVLIFVEDPGAANYVATLPDALRARGWRVHLLSGGTATRFLSDRGVESRPWQEGDDPGRLLQDLRPDVVVVGTAENPLTPGLALVDHAAAEGLPSVGVVDNIANAAFRFRGTADSPLAHVPRWLLVPDVATCAEYARLGFPPERVLASGHPHYDFLAEKREALGQASREELKATLFGEALSREPVVVFAAETSDGLDPAQYRRSPQYTLHGRGRRHGRTEIVLEEFLDAVRLLPVRARLVLRLHPKNTEEEFADFLGAFDVVSRREPHLEVAFAADLLVGMTSMIVMEAAMLGRPTLSIVPREQETGWLPSIAMGLTPAVTTRPALEAFFRADLAERVDLSSVPRGSLARVVAFLETLTEEESARVPRNLREP